MSEITRHLLDREIAEHVQTNNDLRQVMRAFKEVCDRFVSPDLYPHAMAMYEKALLRPPNPPAK